MTSKCTNKAAVLAELERVLPYDFKAHNATIRSLENSENRAIYIFIEHKNYWHSYYIRPDGSLSQGRGWQVPDDEGVPPTTQGLFKPDAVARARQVIQASCKKALQ